jgi:predicted RNase H-like HicB family nuclease
MKLTYTIVLLPDSEGGYVVEVPVCQGASLMDIL